MYDLCQDHAGIALPIFVVATMVNVGLTQTPGLVVGSLRNVPCVTKMLVANVVAAPLTLFTANQKFAHPDVFVTITLVNTLGIVVLISVALALTKDNEAVEVGTSPSGVPLPRLRRGAQSGQ